MASSAGVPLLPASDLQGFLEFARGVIPDRNGRPLTIHSGNSLVAAGDRRRHADALRLLRDDAQGPGSRPG